MLLVEQRIVPKTFVRLAKFAFADDDYVPDPPHDGSAPVPLWIRFQAGERNNDKRVVDLKKKLDYNEWPMDAIKGLAALYLLPQIYEQHQISELPGTVIAPRRTNHAFVGLVGSYNNWKPTLSHCASDSHHFNHGMATYIRYGRP